MEFHFASVKEFKDAVTVTKFKTKRSPIVYMGGKYWEIQQLLNIFNLSDKKVFVDLFGGSGTVSINVAKNLGDRFSKVIYNEIDFLVFSIFSMLLETTGEELAKLQENMFPYKTRLGSAVSSAWRYTKKQTPECQMRFAKSLQKLVASDRRIVEAVCEIAGVQMSDLFAKNRTLSGVSFAGTAESETLKQVAKAIVYLAKDEFYRVRDRFFSKVGATGCSDCGSSVVKYVQKNGSDIFKEYFVLSANSIMGIANPCSFSKKSHNMFDVCCAKVETSNKDYKSCIYQNSLLYLDPPYLVTVEDYKSGWSEKQEKGLYRYIDEQVAVGNDFVLSNVLSFEGRENKILKAWMKKYNVVTVKKHYAPMNSTMKESVEVIVTNLPISKLINKGMF